MDRGSVGTNPTSPPMMPAVEESSVKESFPCPGWSWSPLKTPLYPQRPTQKCSWGPFQASHTNNWSWSPRGFSPVAYNPRVRLSWGAVGHCSTGIPGAGCKKFEGGRVLKKSKRKRLSSSKRRALKRKRLLLSSLNDSASHISLCGISSSMSTRSDSPLESSSRASTNRWSRSPSPIDFPDDIPALNVARSRSLSPTSAPPLNILTNKKSKSSPPIFMSLVKVNDSNQIKGLQMKSRSVLDIFLQSLPDGCHEEEVSEDDNHALDKEKSFVECSEPSLKKPSKKILLNRGTLNSSSLQMPEEHSKNSYTETSSEKMGSSLDENAIPCDKSTDANMRDRFSMDTSDTVTMSCDKSLDTNIDADIFTLSTATIPCGKSIDANVEDKLSMGIQNAVTLPCDKSLDMNAKDEFPVDTPKKKEKMDSLGIEDSSSQVTCSLSPDKELTIFEVTKSSSPKSDNPSHSLSTVSLDDSSQTISLLGEYSNIVTDNSPFLSLSVSQTLFAKTESPQQTPTNSLPISSSASDNLAQPLQNALRHPSDSARTPLIRDNARQWNFSPEPLSSLSSDGLSWNVSPLPFVTPIGSFSDSRTETIDSSPAHMDDTSQKIASANTSFPVLCRKSEEISPTNKGLEPPVKENLSSIAPLVKNVSSSGIDASETSYTTETTAEERLGGSLLIPTPFLTADENSLWTLSLMGNKLPPSDKGLQTADLTVRRLSSSDSESSSETVPRRSTPSVDRSNIVPFGSERQALPYEDKSLNNTPTPYFMDCTPSHSSLNQLAFIKDLDNFPTDVSLSGDDSQPQNESPVANDSSQIAKDNSQLDTTLESACVIADLTTLSKDRSTSHPVTENVSSLSDNRSENPCLEKEITPPTADDRLSTLPVAQRFLVQRIVSSSSLSSVSEISPLPVDHQSERHSVLEENSLLPITMISKSLLVVERSPSPLDNSSRSSSLVSHRSTSTNGRSRSPSPMSERPYSPSDNMSRSPSPVSHGCTLINDRPRNASPISERSHSSSDNESRCQSPISHRSTSTNGRSRTSSPLAERSLSPSDNRSRNQSPLSHRSSSTIGQSRTPISERSHSPLDNRSRSPSSISRRSMSPIGRSKTPPMSERCHPPLNNRSRSPSPDSVRGTSRNGQPRTPSPMSKNSSSPFDSRSFSHLSLIGSFSLPVGDRSRRPLRSERFSSSSDERSRSQSPVIQDNVSSGSLSPMTVGAVESTSPLVTSVSASQPEKKPRTLSPVEQRSLSPNEDESKHRVATENTLSNYRSRNHSPVSKGSSEDEVYSPSGPAERSPSPFDNRSQSPAVLAESPLSYKERSKSPLPTEKSPSPAEGKSRRSLSVEERFPSSSNDKSKSCPVPEKIPFPIDKSRSPSPVVYGFSPADILPMAERFDRKSSSTSDVEKPCIPVNDNLTSSCLVVQSTITLSGNRSGSPGAVTENHDIFETEQRSSSVIDNKSELTDTATTLQEEVLSEKGQNIDDEKMEVPVDELKYSPVSNDKDQRNFKMLPEYSPTPIENLSLEYSSVSFRNIPPSPSSDGNVTDMSIDFTSDNSVDDNDKSHKVETASSGTEHCSSSTFTRGIKRIRSPSPQPIVRALSIKQNLGTYSALKDDQLLVSQNRSRISALGGRLALNKQTCKLFAAQDSNIQSFEDEHIHKEEKGKPSGILLELYESSAQGGIFTPKLYHQRRRQRTITTRSSIKKLRRRTPNHDLTYITQKRMDLIKAVEEGNMPKIQELVQDLGPAVREEKTGSTLLHIAAVHNQVDTMLFLLRLINPNVVNNEGQTPAHLAAKMGHSQILRIMMTDEELCHEKRDKQGRTYLNLLSSPLSDAVLGKNKSQVQELLKLGADADHNAGALVKGQLPSDVQVSSPRQLAVDLGLQSILQLFPKKKPEPMVKKSKDPDFAFFANTVHSSSAKGKQYPEPLDMIVKPAKETVEGEDVYNMDTEPRGFVCILDYNSFEGRHDLDLEGAMQDVSNLASVFSKMGYAGEVYSSPTAEDTTEILLKVRDKDILKEAGCLLVIINGHGVGEDKFLTSDLKLMDVNRTCDLFKDSECPHMINKPKFFIFNTGSGLYRETKRGRYSKSTSMRVSEPLRDTLCLFSSNKGYASYSYSDNGTPFILALCSTLAKHAHNKEVNDLFREFLKEYGKSSPVTVPELRNIGFSNKFFFNPVE